MARGSMRSAEWVEIRAVVLRRDGLRCVECGASSRLECHHIRPLHRGGDNRLDNLETLCTKCHIEKHRRTPIGPRGRAWDTLARKRILQS